MYRIKHILLLTLVTPTAFASPSCDLLEERIIDIYEDLKDTSLQKSIRKKMETVNELLDTYKYLECPMDTLKVKMDEVSK